MRKKSAYYFIYPLIIFLFFSFILYLYLRNITHDVYAGDIGDIATAAALFGVAHPPGYPTITFLGFIFSKLPLPLPVISRIALVSVSAAVGGLVIYFKFVLEILEYLNQKYKSKRNAAFRLRSSGQFLGIDYTHFAIAILSTGILAFSYYYWLYAEVPEVFALNNFFIIAMYYTAFLFYRTQKMRLLYLTAFIGGLVMTNQHAGMFAYPGVGILVLIVLWNKIYKQYVLKAKSIFGIVLLFSKVTFRNFSVYRNILLAFLLGLTPYIYVFISAFTKPQINWMKEPNFYNFTRLILRMDYPMFETPIGLMQRLMLQNIYFFSLINTFSIVFLIIIILGAFYLLKTQKHIFIFLLTGFIFAGPVFIFLITPEIIDADEIGIVERMFVQSFVLFTFFLPFGFIALLHFFYKIVPRKIYGLILLLPFFIALGQMIFYNFPKTDLSKTKIGSSFVYDLLGPLPKNSMIFLLGDSGTLNTWFVHYVEGYRPDIILAGAAGDRSDFEKKIVKDYKTKHKGTKLSDEAIVIGMFPQILKDRKIYSMFKFSIGRKDYIWVPKGLVFELMPVSEIPPKAAYFSEVGKIIKQYHIAYRDRLLPSEQNNTAPYMSRQYANAFNFIGDYLYVRYDDRASAFGYYLTAQMIDPQNSLTFAKLAIVQAELQGQCRWAVENIDTSITMYKIYRPYYTFALRIYDKCDVSDPKIDKLKSDYKKLFGKDLVKDPHY